jgi:hypothetical protein
MRLRLMSLILVILLAACQPQTQDNSSIPPTVPVQSQDIPITIDWDRSPSTVVFRAEIAGGNLGQDFTARNDIPFCTVYGDNRVVWTTSNVSINDVVVYDIVSDEAIQLFIAKLLDVHQLYDFNTGVDLIGPSEVEPVYERLTLYINANLHQTDSFGGWEHDYFQRIVDECNTISLTPVLFEPEGAWLSVQRVDYDPNRTSVIWDSEIAGLNLGEVADSGKPLWITGRNMLYLWERIHTGGWDVQFEEGTSSYQVVLEVPNVTRSSPPAP